MILLTGPSASGKTEIAKELTKIYGIKKVVTHTTREIRKGEIDGIDYHFVTKSEFIKLKNEGNFVETTFYNNNYYGTSKKELGSDKVLVIDPVGKDSFLKLNNPKNIFFFINANKELRKKRMIERGDSSENIEQRLKKDETWFDKNSKKGVNFIIINENKSLEEIAREIYNMYVKEINL